MDASLLQKYFAKWKARRTALHGLAAVAAFLAGVVVLFLTFWFTYVVILIGSEGVAAISGFIFSHKLGVPSHVWRLIGSGVFILLLFVQYFRTDPSYWGTYPEGEFSAHPALMATSTTSSVVMLLAHSGTSANMIADILLTGPRLVVGAFRQAAQAVRIRRLDVAGCSTLLAILFERGAVVPYEELQAAGWEPWFGQLRCLEGVRFLEKGLYLSEPLKLELCS